MSAPAGSLAGAEDGPDHRLRRQSLAFSALFCLVLFGLSLLLIAWRMEQVLVTLAQDRTGRMVGQVAEDGENGMRLGLTANDLGFLSVQLQHMGRQDPAVRLAVVMSSEGRVIAESGDVSLRSLIDPRWNTALLRAAPARSSERDGTALRAPAVRQTPAHVLTGVAVLDPAGVPAASVWTVLDPTSVRTQVRAATWAIVLRSLPFVLLTWAVIFVALYGASRQTLRSLQHADLEAPHGGRWMFALLMVGLLVAPLSVIGIAREASRPFVTAQIEANAQAVATTMAARVERSLQLGVPLQSLHGVEALFNEQLAAAPELSELSLLDGNGRELAHLGRDMASGGDRLAESVGLPGGVARVAVGYPRDYVDRTLGAVLVDLLLALIISAVLMRELTRGLWRRSLLHPLLDYRIARLWHRLSGLLRWRRGRALAREESTAVARSQERAREALRIAATVAPHGALTPEQAWPVQMTRLRLAVFLVALSEELLRPFFTVLASEMETGHAAWSPEMLAGIPVAAFMATFAAAQPLGPWLVRRFDLRLTLMAAVLVGAGALASTAWVHQVWLLVTLRAVGGVAYGLALILVQTTVMRFTPPAQRARGLTEVAGAIVAAGIVGPPFGGMVAGRVGDALGMLACALAMLLAFVALWRLKLPLIHSPASARTAGAGAWRGYAAVIREPRAMFIILGAAIPARLVAVAVLSIVVPLYMRDIGEPPAVAGRVLLLYFLCYAVTASVMAHWSDAIGERRTFIVAGAIIAALACLAVPLVGGALGMALCCALLGAGQATQGPSQIALITELFECKPADSRSASPEQALVAYRLIERLGSVTAPFVTALAVLWVGLPGAVSAVGILLAVAGGLVWVGLRPRASSTVSA